MSEHEKCRAGLIGLGLDNDDGHVRITKGKNFHLMGGSRETHEEMQEKCIKFNEKLDMRGKQLEELEHKEFFELASECKMKIVEVQSQPSEKQTPQNPRRNG